LATLATVIGDMSNHWHKLTGPDMKLADARHEAPMTMGCIAISSLARNMLAFMNFAQQARSTSAAASLGAAAGYCLEKVRLKIAH